MWYDCIRYNILWTTLLHTTQDSSASYDFVHYDYDPTPDYDSEEPNSHGTECSGVVGMANNSICGIGVAHQAHIGCEYNNHQNNYTMYEFVAKIIIMNQADYM